MEEVIPKVYLTGDVHGGETIKHLSSKRWKAQKDLSKNDFLICLGDFGFPWRCYVKPEIKEVKSHEDVLISKPDLYWLKWFINKPYTVLALVGNHEGVYSIWDKLPIKYLDSIKGNVKVLPTKYGEIYYLLRDAVYTISGKTFLVVGGALSADKEYRTPDVSWWEMETLTKEEESNILSILDEKRDFDYVLSHTCPSWLVYQMLDYTNVLKINDPVAKFLSFIEERIDYTEWHFGHLHVSKTLNIHGESFTAHYTEEPLRLL